jgi:FixJ family two-component response regulator
MVHTSWCSTEEETAMNLHERALSRSAESTANIVPRVLVVDDDISVRQSLELLIQHAGWRPQTFASAEEFLSRPRVLTPSCLVLDVNLPDMSGLDLQKLVADRVEMPIIFITGRVDVPMTVEAMKAGAVEFLTKPFSQEVLLAAVRQAIARSRAALEHDAEIQLLRNRYESLSRHEREVMALIVAGLLNKQAAADLGISEITVKGHRGRAMRKMQANSFLHLVNMAMRLKIGHPL